VRLWHELSDPVLQWLREHESAELKHDEDKSKTTPRQDGEEPQPKKPDDKSRPAKDRNAARKHRDEVLQQLQQRLHAIPHVVQTSGFTLTRNERKMIVAAVGLCEINNDVFGASAADPEFIGRKFMKHGSEQTYSRIAHIGLSYGYIQFTQDSWNLGRLLDG
jgi:hypothetical protein